MCGMWFLTSTLTLGSHNVYRNREKSIPMVVLKCHSLYISLVEDRLFTVHTKSSLTHRPGLGQPLVGIFDKQLENY